MWDLPERVGICRHATLFAAVYQNGLKRIPRQIGSDGLLDLRDRLIRFDADGRYSAS
jgi:hypothetical protein